MLRFTSSFSHHLIQLITMWWSTDSSAPRQYMLQIWWWDHKVDHWSLILVPTTLINHFILEHLFVVANPLRVQMSAQIQISQAVSSKHPPPGFFIIAHMGVEVLQQIEYRVFRQYPFHNISGNSSKPSPQCFKCSAGGFWVSPHSG